MIRILIIDDLESPEFIEEMKRDVSSSFNDTVGQTSRPAA